MWPLKKNVTFFKKKMPDSFGSFKKTTTFALAIGKNDERLQK